MSATKERLLQQMELFVEGVSPTVVIFIDEADRDLEDMARALDVETRIFRVRKFVVDGRAEYYSPDRSAPVIETTPAETETATASDYDIIELLGGGKLEASVRRFRCYRLENGNVVHIKRSKFYTSGQNYWYGISPASLQHMETHSVSQVVLVMGDYGLAAIPMEVIRQYLEQAYTTTNSDGSVRHYHLYVSHDPEPKLYSSTEHEPIPVGEFFHPFD